jgi:DNA-binding transcriptional ArsR family regulator
VFSALGDENRLRILARLCARGPMSIAGLAEGSKLTRQGITKHLRVMDRAGLVHCRRLGRESEWQVDPRSVQQAQRYLEQISTQWDHALARLKAFVE